MAWVAGLGAAVREGVAAVAHRGEDEAMNARGAGEGLVAHLQQAHGLQHVPSLVPGVP